MHNCSPKLLQDFLYWRIVQMCKCFSASLPLYHNLMLLYGAHQSNFIRQALWSPCLLSFHFWKWTSSFPTVFIERVYSQSVFCLWKWTYFTMCVLWPHLNNWVSRAWPGYIALHKRLGSHLFFYLTISLNSRIFFMCCILKC